MIDADRMRSQWAQLTARPGLDELAATFYAWLFVANPGAWRLFPAGMSAQRGHLVEAIGAVVANVDHLDAVQPVLERLGRDHRRYGATDAHYDAVGRALLDTIGHYLPGEDRTDWEAAYATASEVMRAAAWAAADQGIPPWLDVVPAMRTVADGVLALAVDFPRGTDWGYLPDEGCRYPASPRGRPGMWVELTVFGHHLETDTGVTRGVLTHTVDPREPASLALLYLPDGEHVRLGVSYPPAQEDSV